MKPSKLALFESAKAKVAKIEAQIAQELRAELVHLPHRYGFDSVSSFIAAPKATGSDAVRRVNNSTRRPRTLITQEMRARVEQLIKAKERAPTITDEVGISLPAVNRIKQVLGLTKKRG